MGLFKVSGKVKNENSCLHHLVKKVLSNKELFHTTSHKTDTCTKKSVIGKAGEICRQLSL